MSDIMARLGFLCAFFSLTLSSWNLVSMGVRFIIVSESLAVGGVVRGARRVVGGQFVSDGGMWRADRWRRTVATVLLYWAGYELLRCAVLPAKTPAFVSKTLRPPGDVFIRVQGAPSPHSPLPAPGCPGCVATPARGFMPPELYDAELATDPHSSRLQLRASPACVRSQFRSCESQPRVTTPAGDRSYHLCELCRILKDTHPLR